MTNFVARIVTVNLGQKVIYKPLRIKAQVVGYVEGWYELQFADDTRAIVRPSHIERSQDD